MTLPATGPISFADINTELLFSPNTANSNFNNADFRVVANITTLGAQISVDDFHGKGRPQGTYYWSTAGSYSYTVPQGVYRIYISAIGGGSATYGVHDGGHCQYSYPGGCGGAVQNIAVAVTPGGIFNFTVGTKGGSGFYNGGTGAAGTSTIVSYNGTTVVTCAQGSQPTAMTQGLVSINTGNPLVSGGALITSSAGATTSGCDGSPYNTYDCYSYAVYYNNYAVLGSFAATVNTNAPHAGKCRFDGIVQIALG